MEDDRAEQHQGFSARLLARMVKDKLEYYHDG